jgi:hypothetical protein
LLEALSSHQSLKETLDKSVGEDFPPKSTK